MKKIFKTTIALMSYCSTLFSIQVEEITDTFLRENACTDHVQHFQKFFQEVKIDSFLEFGLGLGTKYFLGKCSQVTSCEIILPDQTDDWFRETQNLFKNYSNWTPQLIRGSEHLRKANLMSIDRKDPALYDASYLLELKELCNEIFKNRSYDIAFVDPGFHMRGDLVNELFDRVPIIAAHDTNKGSETYGWHKINIPSNYEKYVFPRGQGVTFWVRKDKKDVVAALNQIFGMPYREPPRKNLRIFFPQMHPVLVQSMALVFRHLGHTLVLPGESFDPNSLQPGLKISYGSFFKKNPIDTLSFTPFFSDSPEDCDFLKHNVEVIENDALLTHPPDVLFVNCKQVEKDMYQILKHYKKNKKPLPKVAHFSGNNNTVYDSKYVSNLIAVDAFTAKNYDRMKTNIIFWIPWIDFENFEFEGVSDSPVLNSYIAHYYKNPSKPTATLFNEVVTQTKAQFPRLEINSYPNGKITPHITEMPYLFNTSCATLHIKKTEGFGYTIIESLAKGRPVFLKRSLSEGSRLMNWCIEGKTAFFFDDYAEFQYKLSRYLEDEEFRHQVQRDCAQTIRQLIDNEKQARILDRFLQNLK